MLSRGTLHITVYADASDEAAFVMAKTNLMRILTAGGLHYYLSLELISRDTDGGLHELATERG